jgi:hypothetical protein
MDGLYAAGPVIRKCRDYNWDYIITFKDGSIPALAEDAHALMRYDTSNRIKVDREGRDVVIDWVNGVEHKVSKNNTYLHLNVVRMVETWVEQHSITKNPKKINSCTYQWLSSFPISKSNALEICNTGRNRWFIENHIKTEKHDGYAFEHCFSLDWNVNIAYHYFMNFGHFINVMFMSSEIFAELISVLGSIVAFLQNIRLVFMGFLLDVESITKATLEGFRLCFNTESIYIKHTSSS